MAARLLLDHIIVGCDTLEQGAAYLRDSLGVEIGPGGQHRGAGTWNHLMQIGGGSYLELIARDPAQPDPPHPRGFSLDDPEQRLRLRERPRPVGWIAGTSDVDAAVALSPVDIGLPAAMSRGELAWRVTKRADGRMAEGGTMPGLIEWPKGQHPSAKMSDSGVRLDRLRLLHPQPERLAAWLAALGATHLAEIEATGGAPRVEVDLIAPNGARVTLR